MSITRTTVSIDTGLLDTAKQLAAEQNRTLGQLMTEALRSHMVNTASAPRQPVVLPTAGQGGVRPGVTLNSNAALFALLDDADEARWSSQM